MCTVLDMDVKCLEKQLGPKWRKKDQEVKWVWLSVARRKRVIEVNDALYAECRDSPPKKNDLMAGTCKQGKQPCNNDRMNGRNLQCRARKPLQRGGLPWLWHGRPLFDPR